MPQLQHSDWTLDGDTAGVDTLGNIGYSKNRQSINSGNNAEIKKRIIHDFSCYYAIYTFCYNMKQAITKGYKGEGLLTLTEELVENDDLLVISNTEFKWLLQQFDFSTSLDYYRHTQVATGASGVISPRVTWGIQQ